jgi:hypothetical protein
LLTAVAPGKSCSNGTETPSAGRRTAASGYETSGIVGGLDHRRNYPERPSVAGTHDGGFIEQRYPDERRGPGFLDYRKKRQKIRIARGSVPRTDGTAIQPSTAVWPSALFA